MEALAQQIGQFFALMFATFIAGTGLNIIAFISGRRQLTIAATNKAAETASKTVEPALQQLQLQSASMEKQGATFLQMVQAINESNQVQRESWTEAFKFKDETQRALETRIAHLETDLRAYQKASVDALMLADQTLRDKDLMHTRINTLQEAQRLSTEAAGKAAVDISLLQKNLETVSTNLATAQRELGAAQEDLIAANKRIEQIERERNEERMTANTERETLVKDLDAEREKVTKLQAEVIVLRAEIARLEGALQKAQEENAARVELSAVSTQELAAVLPVIDPSKDKE
jgi:chromosome segregation ATPase